MYNLNKLQKSLLKIGIFALFALIYFKGIIPLREVAMSQVHSYVEVNKNESVIITKTALRTMSLGIIDTDVEYQIRVPFGMNFFIGIFGLIFMSAHRKYMYAEIATQVVCGIVIFLTVLLGIGGASLPLIISDLFSVYLLPLSSLVMVILAFIEKKHLREVATDER